MFIATRPEAWVPGVASGVEDAGSRKRQRLRRPRLGFGYWKSFFLPVGFEWRRSQVPFNWVVHVSS